MITNNIYRSLLVILLPTFTLIGCQTSMNKVDTVKYTKNIYAQSEDKIFKQECPSVNLKRVQAAHWKMLMEFSRGCVSKKNWSNLEKISHLMAKKEPHSPWASYFLSLSFEGQQNLIKAMWSIEQAISKTSNIGLITYQKARLLWKEERFSESKEFLLKALDQDDNLTDARLMLGNIYHRDRLWEDAFKHYSKVLVSRSGQKQALIGVIDYYIEERNSKKALEYITESFKYYPNDLMTWSRKAFVYEVLIQDYAKALDIYSEIQNKMRTGKIKGVPGYVLEEKIQEIKKKINPNRNVASGVKS